ncbi:hypothetical protein D3C86_2072040 [compost metagenome]
MAGLDRRLVGGGVVYSGDSRVDRQQGQLADGPLDSHQLGRPFQNLPGKDPEVEKARSGGVSVE